jgi:surface polysaccharide O-acyltransferase-like enzyme
MYLTGSNLGHLWFFVLIIQLYILYPVIEKIFTKSVENAKTPQLLIFLFIVQILYHFFSIGEIFLMGTATLFLAYLFYFVLGMYVRFHYLNYKNKVTIVQMHPNGVFSALVCATILGIGNRYIQYFSRDFLPQVILINDWTDAIVTPLFYIIIFTVFVFTALKISEMTPNYITKSLRIVGNYSMGIYLIHTFIQHALVLGLYQKIGFDINNWLFFPVDFTLVLSLSLAFVYIMNKVPYHEYIIGSSR